MLLIYRTQLFGPSDLDAVKAIQAKYKIAPLSAYAETAPPVPAAALDWIAPIRADEERTSLEFFNILAGVLTYCPPLPDEAAIRDGLATLGNPNTLTAAQQQALLAGMAAGQKQIDAARAEVTTSADLFGSRSELGTAYLKRAVAAQYGILGNTAAEAVYLGYVTGPAGQPLTGNEAYLLRFAPGQFPPVNAFWSLTMYNLPEQLLVANPLNRYLINSPMLPQLTKDPDDGFSLYIQSTSPGADKEPNWLPSPDGPFFMVLRCYYPARQVLDGTWQQPALTAMP
jgi:hypothetical protein